MIRENRLIRVEASLTPKQAVFLWLRQELQGKTSSEYVRWSIQQPPSSAPRSRVERQVVDAIRAAMKGQDPRRINQAVKQGQMHTDFLILLIMRSNSAILDDSRARSLQIALLFEQLRNAALSDDEESAVTKWAANLQGFATELFAVRRASELIRDRYFDGEGILLKDASEDLEHQTKAVQLMMDSYDRVAIEAGRPELIIDSDKLRTGVNNDASHGAGYIVALARSKMLDDFGEDEAADTLLKPYFLKKPVTETGNSRTT